MADSEHGQLGLDLDKNALILQSKTLTRRIVHYEKSVSLLLSDYIKIWKNTDTSSNRDINARVQDSIQVLKSLNQAVNTILSQIKYVASDTEFETHENNCLMLSQLMDLLNGREFKTLHKQFINATLFSSNQLNPSATTFSARSVSIVLSIRRTIKEIPHHILGLIRQTQKYVAYKQREETLSSRTTRQGILRGSVQHLRQKGVGDFITKAKRGIESNVGIDRHDSTRTRARKIGGLALGGLGFFAAAYFKSPALAVGATLYLKKRQDVIEKNRELYKKRLNDLQKQREIIQDAARKSIINQSRIEKSRALRSDGFISSDLSRFGGGTAGIIKPKLAKNILVGEEGKEKVEVFDNALRKKEDYFTKGSEVRKIDSPFRVTPTYNGGTTVAKTSDFSKFGGGTGFEDDGSKNDKIDELVSIAQKQLSVLEKISLDNYLYYDHMIEDMADQKNRFKGGSKSESKIPSQAETMKEKVKEKGLIGAMVDTVKNRITEKLVDKMFGGFEKMTAGNIIRTGGRMALTAGGAVAGGVGGYKLGDWGAEKLGLEEGGTGEKIMKYGGAATGAIVGGLAGKFLGNKFLGNKDVAPDVQKVHVVNAEDMSGGSDLLSPKGGLWKTLKNVAGKGKGLGLSALTSLGGLNAAGIPSLGIAGGAGGAAAGAGLLGAAGAAAYGLHGTYKAITTGESQQNRIAQKIGLVKSKKDIESGIDTRSNWNPLKHLGAGFDSAIELAAKASIKIENVFNKQNKREDDKIKSQEELLKKQEEGQTGFLDQLTSSDNPLLKGMGSVLSTSVQAIKSAKQIYSESRASGGGFIDSIGAAAKGGTKVLTGKAAENRKAMEDEMTAQGITDPKQRAVLMGQFGHETAGFAKMEEGKYSAESVWKLRGNQLAKQGVTLDTLKQAQASGGKDAMYEYMYGGRLGNTALGDAAKYKGRGHVQLTGKSNYADMSKRLQQQGMNVDLVKNPEIAADPKIAAKIGILYAQKTKGVMEAAKAGDVGAVSRGINAGNVHSKAKIHGMEDRQRRTNLEYAGMVKTPTSQPVSAKQKIEPVLQQASTQKGVEPVQPVAEKKYSAGDLFNERKSISGDYDSKRKILFSKFQSGTLSESDYTAQSKALTDERATKMSAIADMTAKAEKGQWVTETEFNQKMNIGKKQIGNIPAQIDQQAAQNASNINVVANTKKEPIPQNRVTTFNSKIQESKVEIAQAKMQQTPTEKTESKAPTVINNVSSNQQSAGPKNINLSSGDSSWVTTLIKMGV